MDNGASRRRRPGPLSDLPSDLPPERAALVAELRHGRGNANLSTAELAQRTLSSRASVSRWLNGRALPGKDQAIAWAQACGTDETAMIQLLDAAALAAANDGRACSAATASQELKAGEPDSPAGLRRKPTRLLPSASGYRLRSRSAVAILTVCVLAAVLTVTLLDRQDPTLKNPAPRSGEVALTAGPRSTVGNCEVFSGTSDLPRGQTIVLGQRNHSDLTKTIYLQPVNSWQDPAALARWTGSQYFGSGTASVGQIYEIFVISMNVSVVRDAMRLRVGDVWHVGRLPRSSKVKQTYTVTRVTQPGPCGN